MFRSNCHRALWACGLQHFAKAMQLTATKAAGLEGKTPLVHVTGEIPDVSQCFDFVLYDWVCH